VRNERIVSGAVKRESDVADQNTVIKRVKRRRNVQSKQNGSTTSRDGTNDAALHPSAAAVSWTQWLNSAGTGRNAVPAPVIGVVPPPTGVPAPEKCVRAP